MIRKIVSINEQLCNGCGLCASACHEGAIAMVNGKAKLIRDDYCDGLGDCLPACPTGAISIMPHSCPGSMARALHPQPASNVSTAVPQSQLSQWPVQLRLVAPNASFFEDAHLLIAADCTAFAYADFHNRFIRNRVTLVGCPKLDPVDYAEKLTEILKSKSITLVRMEVPCCGGLENALKKALAACGKLIPWQVEIISIDGQIKE